MQDLNPVDNYLHGSWEALGNGAPMLVALAQLASERWVAATEPADASRLSLPSQAILFAARKRGLLEIRAVNSAFDAAARMLAVYVEVDSESTIAFRDATDPGITLQFLEGFRDLCAAGLILHHIHRDFSLSPRALQIAKQIPEAEVQGWLEKATEYGIHE